MVASCSSSLVWFRERASAMMVAVSGTTLRACPPVMTPTLFVVSASIRPTGNDAIAFAAATIALMPFSGSAPACAAFP